MKILLLLFLSVSLITAARLHPNQIPEWCKDKITNLDAKNRALDTITRDFDENFNVINEYTKLMIKKADEGLTHEEEIEFRKLKPLVDAYVGRFNNQKQSFIRD